MQHELKVNEGVLRFAVLKREALPRVTVPRRRAQLPSGRLVPLDWAPSEEEQGQAAAAAADAADDDRTEAELRALRELILAGGAPAQAAGGPTPA